jgi:excinuclease ABC subunit C
LCLDYHIHRCEGPCQGLVEPKKYQQMITLVETFLKGKTKDLITELREKMEAESRDLNFENAARIRDQIKLIENYHFSAQKVVLTDMEDRDVIALATEEPDACIVVFKIRDGKVIGRQHFYLDRIEGKSFSEILEHFLQQYYLETDYYPGQIILPEKIENEDTFLKWLEKQAQHKVELLVPQIGEKKKLISLCQKNAKYLLNELMEQKQKGKEYVANSVKLLQKNLNLKKPPKHIEAFDISNIQGKEAVASMVYFWNGQPRKSEYRKFKIKSKETPDDFAMMREVVFRRYRRLLNEGIDLPDLILVDGGKGQLSTALQVLSELGIQDQPIIGLAKKLEEVFLPGLSDPQNIPKNSPGLRLLQHIRDEAHRFAIAYHRKLRDKKAIRSPLDDIPGIGSKRRTDLLKTFGSLKNIRNSSLEDLIKKGKIPKNVAILLSQKLQENSNAKINKMKNIRIKR